MEPQSYLPVLDLRKHLVELYYSNSTTEFAISAILINANASAGVHNNEKFHVGHIDDVLRQRLCRGQQMGG